MNVIFLDVDGVLNGYHSSIERIKKNIDTPNIDIEKIKILSIICNELDASVVLSSSWKLGKEVFIREDDKFGMAPYLEYLLNLLKNYNINFIGFTPDIKTKYGCTTQKMWKENDIRLYLWLHPDIDHFCIIDDDLFDLNKLKDYVVKTKYYGNSKEDEGLKLEHLENIRNILNKNHKYKKDKLLSLRK